VEEESSGLVGVFTEGIDIGEIRGRRMGDPWEISVGDPWEMHRRCMEDIWQM
jgi:hypothetical protein